MIYDKISFLAPATDVYLAIQSNAISACQSNSDRRGNRPRALTLASKPVLFEKMSIYNEEHMKAALRVAQEAYDNLEVPVGCVFVKDNQTIIAQGRNRPNETFNVCGINPFHRFT